jgi:hypothetical protein
MEYRVMLISTTGRQATANVKESLEWGTKIVGGVVEISITRYSIAGHVWFKTNRKNYL